MNGESFWEKLREAEKFRYGNRNSKIVEPSGPPKDIMKKMGRRFLIFAVVMFLVITVLNCYYTLGVNEVGVLTTLGTPESVTTPGIHMKWPYVQRINKMSKEIRGMEIGYDTTTAGQGNPDSVRADSEMITKILFVT